MGRPIGGPDMGRIGGADIGRMGGADIGRSGGADIGLTGGAIIRIAVAGDVAIELPVAEAEDIWNTALERRLLRRSTLQ